MAAVPPHRPVQEVRGPLRVPPEVPADVDIEARLHRDRQAAGSPSSQVQEREPTTAVHNFGYGGGLADHELVSLVAAAVTYNK